MRSGVNTTNYFEQGEKLYCQKPKSDFINALAMFQEAVKIDPNNYKAWWYIGTCYRNIKPANPLKAIEAYTKSLEIKPNAWAWDNYHCLGVTHYRSLGNYKETIDALTHAINIRPDGRSYYYRSLAYVQLKEFQKAISDAKEAAKLSPDYDPKWLPLLEEKSKKLNADYQEGKRLYNLQPDRDFVNALTFFLKVVEVDKKNPDAWWYVGQCYKNIKPANLALALNAYSQSIEANKDYSWGYLARGTLYYNQGKYQEALTDLTEAIRLNPKDHYAYYYRAQTYSCLYEFQKAMDDIEVSFQIYPAYSASSRDAIKQKLSEIKRFEIGDHAGSVEIKPIPSSSSGKEFLVNYTSPSQQSFSFYIQESASNYSAVHHSNPDKLKMMVSKSALEAEMQKFNKLSENERKPAAMASIGLKNLHDFHHGLTNPSEHIANFSGIEKTSETIKKEIEKSEIHIKYNSNTIFSKIPDDKNSPKWLMSQQVIIPDSKSNKEKNSNETQSKTNVDRPKELIKLVAESLITIDAFPTYITGTLKFILNVDGTVSRFDVAPKEANLIEKSICGASYVGANLVINAIGLTVLTEFAFAGLLAAPETGGWSMLAFPLAMYGAQEVPKLANKGGNLAQNTCHAVFELMNTPELSPLLIPPTQQINKTNGASRIVGLNVDLSSNGIIPGRTSAFKKQVGDIFSSHATVKKMLDQRLDPIRLEKALPNSHSQNIQTKSTPEISKAPVSTQPTSAQKNTLAKEDAQTKLYYQSQQKKSQPPIQQLQNVVVVQQTVSRNQNVSTNTNHGSVVTSGGMAVFSSGSNVTSGSQSYGGGIGSYSDRQSYDGWGRMR